jgi:hypothetical protein
LSAYYASPFAEYRLHNIGGLLLSVRIGLAAGKGVGQLGLPNYVKSFMRRSRTLILTGSLLFEHIR